MQNTLEAVSVSTSSRTLEIPSIIRIEYDGVIFAYVISSQFRASGVHFVTPDHLPQQMAFMRHSAGKIIAPHLHNETPRMITKTSEALFVRKGKVRVDFFDSKKNWKGSHTLVTGDVILLVDGGHGFEVLEELEMIEVKQGPYVGEKDKIRFNYPV